jgi:hypothetical protein
MKVRFQSYYDEEGEEQGEGSGRSDHAVRADEFYNKQQGKIPTRKKFIPRRRGSAKITWPLAPKRALIFLTGRKSLSRALDAYESFFRARRRTFPRHLPRFSSRTIREQAMNGPWTRKFFLEEAEQYCLYPRKGFQIERQKKRISKLLFELGLK